jgi:hypothetical protein
MKTQLCSTISDEDIIAILNSPTANGLQDLAKHMADSFRAEVAAGAIRKSVKTTVTVTWKNQWTPAPREVK